MFCVAFSFTLDTIFQLVSLLHLFDDICFQYSKVFESFFFFECSDYHYYSTLSEFLSSALADGVSLKSKWQVSSSLQNYSQYYGRSQQCCCSVCLHLASYFQVIYSFYRTFGGCAKRTNDNRYFHVPHFFQFPSKVQVLILHLVFFQFYSGVRPQFGKFLLIIIRSGRPSEISLAVCISKSQRSCASHSPGQVLSYS